MNLTAAARKRFVEELIAFETAAEEIRDRFYNFLVTHDPKGYADYQIFPFKDSKAPLWRGYFKLVPYRADVAYDETVAEPSNSMSFEGPMSKREIQYAKEAAESMSGLFTDNEKPLPLELDPENEDDLRNLSEAWCPEINKTQNEWNEQFLYIHVPDAYIDDPDAWEAQVLADMEADRALAKEAVEIIFGEKEEPLTFDVRRFFDTNSEYIRVRLSDELSEEDWAALKTTEYDDYPVLYVSHKNGNIFDIRPPWRGEKNPEKERNFLGKVVSKNVRP